MTDQSVFDNIETQSQPAQAPQPNSNPFADQLAKIVNEEGKPKYDTLDKALDGLAHAQSYIPQLKSDVSVKDAEIAKLKAELEQRKSVEEVVSRLSSPQVQPEPTEHTTQVAQGLTQEQVAALVQQQLQQQQQQTVAQQNLGKVNSTLTSQYGDKVGEIIQQKAAALNTTAENLKQLAASNPDMVLALFNSNPSNGFKPTTGSINLPNYGKSDSEPLAPPTKSLLSGATTAEQAAYMAKIKAQVYAKYGVQE